MTIADASHVLTLLPPFHVWEHHIRVRWCDRLMSELYAAVSLDTPRVYTGYQIHFYRNKNGYQLWKKLYFLKPLFWFKIWSKNDISIEKLAFYGMWIHFYLIFCYIFIGNKSWKNMTFVTIFWHFSVGKTDLVPCVRLWISCIL